MLDHYQVQLTRMLEAEQYGEAKRLLRFLLQCQGEDRRHYEEWGNLLAWLDMAFPGTGNDSPEGDPDAEEDIDEDSLRREALDPGEQDESYVQQVLYIMKNHPMIDQQMLALERAAHLRSHEVEEAIVKWLSGEAVHPIVQFKALQCLRKRGVTGRIALERLGETVELDVEVTPLSMDDFPSQIQQMLERVEKVTEVNDPTLPHFAKELWKECLQFLYGTSVYSWMLRDDMETVDCFAAALHMTLLLAVYGSADDDEIRDTYGITGELRFRYEQACRALRQIAEFQEGYGDDPEP
ncbi:hypothetical protein VN24_17595 [Paenibacillus beijingensis]|uniref:PIK helical domain-containing protein n=2 Tax=Paenibacillus beijingensis TaxID=1126833 RepID=A0A0D5NLK1_9BACL|nr:hypothetical protein VN24_17595 [Paenibacillus beijingensis]